MALPRNHSTSLVFASHNQGKIEEIRVLANELGIRIRGMDEYPDITMPAEVCSTYEGNAALKAEKVLASLPKESTVTGVLADDAGIEIDALAGLPGVYTAGFGLLRLYDYLLPEVSYDARFVCTLCYAEFGTFFGKVNHQRMVFVAGKLEGRFRIPPRRSLAVNNSPLPYSHYFTPLGEVETVEKLVKTKGYCSHRGLAFKELMRVLD